MGCVHTANPHADPCVVCRVGELERRLDDLRERFERLSKERQAAQLQAAYGSQADLGARFAAVHRTGAPFPEEGVSEEYAETSVTVADGKYRFTLFANDYRVHVFRHGERWLRIETGHHAIAALVTELAEARERIQKLEEERGYRG